MALKATELRTNLYRMLDRVLETGEPVEIERNGRLLRIVAVVPQRKLSKLEPHPDDVVGDPDDLIHIDWSREWRP
ncbi:MAG: type II toxin-antitoxin system Phd/YefM family antitoxin [Deltaproteobacteria bacterium]|nr:type II toxin-antitoxin system Phd/YefM family antitoxin [Deltaproteobacteria bacterium]